MRMMKVNPFIYLLVDSPLSISLRFVFVAFSVGLFLAVLPCKTNKCVVEVESCNFAGLSIRSNL